MPNKTEFESIKGLAAPARRALASAGFAHPEQLPKATEAELAGLHGMGPNALKVLKAALAERGIGFRG